MSTNTFASFAGLIGMGRRHGIDTKPTLLRVLTDLYLQKDQHLPDEARQFTELALGLIDAVDPDTRDAVAVRLATLRAPPPEVMAKLASAQAQDAAEAGADDTALRHAPPHAGAVQPAARPQPENASADDASRRLCDVFFAAGSEERRLIMTNLEFAAMPAPAIAPASARDASRRFEQAVLNGRPADFVREIESTLQVSRDLAERIVNDTSGEPLVGAARALSIPIEVLQRLLLFVNPAIGHSVRRVFDLSTLYHEISPASAAQLAALWRRASPRATPEHSPAARFDRERNAAPDRGVRVQLMPAAAPGLKSQRTT